MKKINNGNKKPDNFWKIFFLMFLLVIIYWCYRFLIIKHSAKYTVGYTIGSDITKGSKKEVYYKYEIYGKEYRGIYLESSVFHQNESIIDSGAMYLILYSWINPKTSYLLNHKLLNNRVNLDSLHQVPVDEEDINIDWKKL